MNKTVEKIAKEVKKQFTDLGAAFLPTARGAELPLPSSIKKEETKKPERRENVLKTL